MVPEGADEVYSFPYNVHLNKDPSTSFSATFVKAVGIALKSVELLEILGETLPSVASTKSPPQSNCSG